MKNNLLFVVLAVFVGLCGYANDRLYIEDFSISPGETRNVSIMLDNETAYTAFQTDIYLPEGLTVEQEDGDYIFDLTSRKGRDHNIATQLQADGSIRIMSYSPSIKAYSGNSGALVTFNITASANIAGTNSILLKNTLFTTTSGTEISLNDETCIVNAPLNDLTGDIVFTEGGAKGQVMDSDKCGILEYYEYVDICYSGSENVSFSIVVNGIDLLGDDAEEYGVNDAIVWNDEINGYRINLYNLRPVGEYDDDYGYSTHFSFEVTVSADGYSDLIAEYNTAYYLGGNWGPEGPITVEMTGMSAFGVRFEVIDGYTISDILVVDSSVTNENIWYCDFILNRLDDEYEVTLQPISKSIGMPFYVFGEKKTFTIPAIYYTIYIDQVSYYNDYGETYLPQVEIYDAYDSSIAVSINGIPATADDYYYSIYDLRPYGEPQGGDYFIHVTAIVNDYLTGEHEVYKEEHIECYIPIISTSFTNDAVIIDVVSEMSEKRLWADGVWTDELPYMMPRLDEDYDVIIEVIHSPDGEVWTWNYDNILIPARISSTLQGDVNGDNIVNISDVTALIDYLLSGDASTIILDNADCNGNGAVNIADVAELIDYLLIGYWPNPEPDPTPVIISFTANGVTFNMVEVEGGTFQMGGTPEQGDNIRDREKPVHQVTLSTYHIGQTEVTQELWQAVMGVNPSYHTGDLQRPVERVSWADCQEFIFRLNQLTGKSFRLPTEAEWENAARGGNKSEGYRYAGGNDMDVVSWYMDNSDNTTHPVGTKAPNELSLYDMTGNVWEWTNDWFKLYTADPQVDPTGPATGNNRVLRGGCWNGDSSYNRISYRDNFTPTGNNSSGGLRLVLDVENSTKFRLNETVVKVEAGWARSVYILNGSGNYTVAGGTNFVTADIDGNKLTVTGTAIGTTTVCVTDAGTGATAVLAVIVTEATSHEEVFTVNGVTFKMITINGGSFIMGATEEMGTEYYTYERPTHMVTLSDYKIGQTEVTQELWQAVMGSNPSNFTGDLQRPVEQVSWNDCQTFITLLNQITGKSFRLPTEAEWEFAARGGNLSQVYTYAGSNNADDVAWLVDNSDSMTHPVGIKAPNELGLYDMSGNVFEWCQDWFGNYSSGAQNNPTGPTDGTYRVCRGGAWNYIAKYCRSSHRSYHSMTSTYDRIGLRLALD